MGDGRSPYTSGKHRDLWNSENKSIITILGEKNQGNAIITFRPLTGKLVKATKES